MSLSVALELVRRSPLPIHYMEEDAARLGRLLPSRNHFHGDVTNRLQRRTVSPERLLEPLVGPALEWRPAPVWPIPHENTATLVPVDAGPESAHRQIASVGAE